MKIDNSLLQAGALLFVGTITIMAAIESNWNIVAMGITGLFAVLSIHPKPPGTPPDAAS